MASQRQLYHQEELDKPLRNKLAVIFLVLSRKVTAVVQILNKIGDTVTTGGADGHDRVLLHGSSRVVWVTLPITEM